MSWACFLAIIKPGLGILKTVLLPIAPIFNVVGIIDLHPVVARRQQVSVAYTQAVSHNYRKTSTTLLLLVQEIHPPRFILDQEKWSNIRSLPGSHYLWKPSTTKKLCTRSQWPLWESMFWTFEGREACEICGALSSPVHSKPFLCMLPCWSEDLISREKTPSVHASKTVAISSFSSFGSNLYHHQALVPENS